MTVSIARPAINFLGELATLRRKVQEIEGDFAQVHFANLVENGGFDSASGWVDMSTGSGSAVIASGVATITSADGSNRGIMYQGFPVGLGRYYGFSYDVTKISGNSYPVFGTQANINNIHSFPNQVTGSYVLNFTAPVDEVYFTMNSNGGVFEHDNASLWEADPADDAIWLRLPYGHKVGKAGQVIRDGLVLMDGDFVEVSDSGQYFIKPLVAPGANTRFTVRCRA